MTERMSLTVTRPSRALRRTPPDGLLLTPAEIKVVQAIADIPTHIAIGKALGLSPHTVNRQLQTARRRLGARTNAHAVTLAYRAGLIT